MVISYLFQLFDTLKARDNEESFKHKVHAVEGDITEDNFGMKEGDVQMLHDKINIVLHSAATINFNEPIEWVTKATLKCQLIIRYIPKVDEDRLHSPWWDW